jgi:thiol-disulfide isomerase/thioredoxin
MKASIGFLLAVSGFAATISAADLFQSKTADDLWLHIGKMQREGPSGQAQTMDEQHAIVKNFLGELDTALVEFCRRYPTDARRWDAKLTRVMCANLSANLEGRPSDRAADEKALKEIAAAADTSTEVKAQASFSLIQFHADPLLQSTNAAALAAVDAEIIAFGKQYPQDLRNEQLRLLQARLFQKADPAKTESLMKTLAKGRDPEIAEEAQGYLIAAEIGRKPVQLKFTAVDGSTVDLDQLRGKVVLLDFWATWCGPCVMSVPKVIATYKKLHNKGFEIVGISLDRNKDSLVAFTKQRGMTWPQYFDGKVWQNDISTRFHVNAIPATWLVDKKGYAHPADDGDLSAQVEKLLSE